jgi:hypothetical protein
MALMKIDLIDAAESRAPRKPEGDFRVFPIGEISLSTIMDLPDCCHLAALGKLIY